MTNFVSNNNTVKPLQLGFDSVQKTSRVNSNRFNDLDSDSEYDKNRLNTTSPHQHAIDSGKFQISNVEVRKNDFLSVSAKSERIGCCAKCKIF